MVMSRVPGKTILERVWFAILNPVDQSVIGRDLEWIGDVKTNKDMAIQYDTINNKRITCHFKKGVPKYCDYMKLTQLMQREIQEGPAEGLKVFHAKGNPRHAVKKGDPALKITIAKDNTEEEEEEPEVTINHGIPDLGPEE